MYKSHNRSFSLANSLWDIWCIISIVGIWPRFIEPRLLSVTNITLPIPNLPKELEGFKLAQFSDLHLHSHISTSLLKKVSARISSFSPNLIAFTGDFICNSILSDALRLSEFLKSFNAPQGCFAVLGNHDYALPVSINEMGEYDVMVTDKSAILRGFSMLFNTPVLAKKATERAKSVGKHADLVKLLESTPFKLLENQCQTISVGNSGLNICGLGEYSLGKTDPAMAFTHYKKDFPGIILLHNPDGFPLLKDYPGDIVLCGHTHGGQINLPWIWEKITLLENMDFKRGLLKRDGKWIYINRGLGAVLPFRFLAAPELLFVTLRRAP